MKRIRYFNRVVFIIFLLVMAPWGVRAQALQPFSATCNNQVFELIPALSKKLPANLEGVPGRILETWEVRAL